MKSVPVLFLLALCVAGTAHATAYRWVDEDGRTVYSQTPPPDRESQRISTSGHRAPSNEEAWKEVERIEEQLDTSREQRRQAAEEAQKQRDEAALRRRNCENARLNLERYEGDPGRLIRDPDGSYVRLTPDQRQARIEETRQQIEEYCR